MVLFLLGVKFGDRAFEGGDLLANIAVVANRRSRPPPAPFVGRWGGLATGRLLRERVGRLGVVDLAGHCRQIGSIVAQIVDHPTILHLHHIRGDGLNERPIVAGEDDRALVGQQGLRQSIDRLHIEVVSRFVEHQHIERPQEQSRHTEAGPLATGENAHPFFHRPAAKEHRAGQIEDLLLLGANIRGAFEIVEHRLFFIDARIDVLGINADLAAVAPLHLAGKRRKRIDKRA